MLIPGSGYDRPHGMALAGDDSVNGHWGMEKMRAYIATIREKFHPTLTPEASGLLENHYSLCRQQENGQNLLTVRFLESLICLSQAHARLMYRDKVLLDDAVAVILLSAPPRHRVVGYLAVAESITPPTISSMIAWQRIQSTPNLDRSMNWMSNLRKRKRSCFVGIKAEIRMQRDIQWSLPAHALLFRNSQCMG